MIKKRLVAQIGAVKIGGGFPVAVQSMTNTNTADVQASVAQCLALARAGSEMIRLTVNNAESAAAIPKIREALDQKNCQVPLIGDFHYNGHTLLKNAPACAEALAKYRINPGNVGFGEKKESQFKAMIDFACRYEKAVRIGVNWGSLDAAVLQKTMDENAQCAKPLSPREIMHKALIASALESAESAVQLGLPKNQIVLSCKVSDAKDLIAIYRQLAKLADYPLHLGLTEAGMGIKGAVASTAALAVLLNEGIGDTIRVSLTPAPGAPRTDEVLVAQEILQSLALRNFRPSVIACPGCGRTSSHYFQELAEEVTHFIADNMARWSQEFQGVENLKIAVMGCIVNGPGESKHANLGISLPGNNEDFSAPLFEDGVKVATLKADNVKAAFFARIEDYICRHYPKIHGKP